MAVTLTIKQVPDDLVEELRNRAKRHHRSLQGELMVILEESLGPRRLSFEEADKLLRARGFHTGDDSTRLVREMRDAR